MKLNKNLVIFAAIAVIAIIGISYYTSGRPITRYDWDGTEIVFRDDLRLAKNVSVYPDENSVYSWIWHPDVYRVKIAYVPTEESSADNGALATNMFEIRFKLDLAYGRQQWGNEFSTLELKSFENLSSANDTLIIALVRPSLSDKNGIEQNGNIVYIKGMTQKDLDLATMKFLMIAMNITV